MGSAAMVIGAGAVLASCAVLAVFLRPTTLFALALGASVFSGNADHIGMPISPDRLLTLAALGSLLLGVSGATRPAGERRIRAVDVLIVAVAVIALASAIAVGSITESSAFFGLLDRLGLVPFVGFLLADRLFGTERDRRTLVVVMIVVGAYLGVTALLEALGGDGFVVPKYINDPALGTHDGRARGPFLEAAANGLALFECGVAAAVGVSLFRDRLVRVASFAVVALCAVGIVATVTRAAWLGAVCGAVVGVVLHPRLRRFLVPIVASGAVLVVAALILVPGLGETATERQAEQLPLWDRQNTNSAALRVVADHPLFGVGWEQFIEVNIDYERQADSYPISPNAPYLGVHNVALSHLAELGLVGGGLWIATVLVAVGAAWRGSASLAPEWRAASMAIFVNWAVVGSFGPLSYAFPNLVMWLWLGLAAAPTARWAVSGETEASPVATVT